MQKYYLLSHDFIYHLIQKTQTIRINEKMVRVKRRKVKLLLLLKACREHSCIPFLTLAPDGGEWSASLPGYSTVGKELQCLFNRKLDSPQSQCGHCGEEINPLLLPRLAMLSQLKQYMLHRRKYHELKCIKTTDARIKSILQVPLHTQG